MLGTQNENIFLKLDTTDLTEMNQNTETHFTWSFEDFLEFEKPFLINQKYCGHDRWPKRLNSMGTEINDKWHAP